MEKWKDVTGYEGVYKVSNFGNVKSVDRIDRRSKSIRQKSKRAIWRICMC